MATDQSRREEIYQSTIAPIEAELIAERDRLEGYGAYIRMGLGAAALASVGGIFFFESSDFDTAPLFFIACIAGLGAMFAPGLIMRDYVKRFKARIVPAVLAQFGKFYYDVVPSNAAFRHLIVPGLLPDYTSIRGEDMIDGTYRGLGFTLVEVKATRVTRSGEHTRSRTVFDGSLIRVALGNHKLAKLKGSYFLSTEWGGGMTSLFSTLSGERIRLESSDFEKLFNFYGDDQIEGRTIMTPAQMERWVAYHQMKEGGSLRAFFGGGVITIAFAHEDDWLDSALLGQDEYDFHAQIGALIMDVDQALSLIDNVVIPEGTDLSGGDDHTDRRGPVPNITRQ